MRNQWHILREPGVLTLTRRLPARFDLAARTDMPLMRRGRLAHQIRQDMWRALRHMRGFSPVVRIEDGDGVLHVQAGGAVDGPCPKLQAQAVVATLLNCPRHRARWLAHAVRP